MEFLHKNNPHVWFHNIKYFFLPVPMMLPMENGYVRECERNRKEIRERAAAVMTGASGHRRVPITFYEELEIPVPSMDEQLRIVAEYQKNISAIMDLRESMSNASSVKQAILDKYLK